MSKDISEKLKTAIMDAMNPHGSKRLSLRYVGYEVKYDYKRMAGNIVVTCEFDDVHSSVKKDARDFVSKGIQRLRTGVGADSMAIGRREPTVIVLIPDTPNLLQKLTQITVAVLAEDEASDVMDAFIEARTNMGEWFGAEGKRALVGALKRKGLLPDAKKIA